MPNVTARGGRPAGGDCPGFDIEPLAQPGAYGDYLLDRVSKVFPELFRDQFGTGR